MIALLLHEIAWCAQHGHPVVMLRATADRYFAVALAADDAASLAAHAGQGPGAARTRLYGLLEATVAGLGARLTEVRLHVGGDRVLRASIVLTGPRGPLALPAYFVDGIVLAHRARLPLRMADEDLARVPLTTLPRADSAPELDHNPPLGPFRHFIESLDLDGLGPLGSPSTEGR